MPRTVRDTVQAHRQQRLRPVQLWLPDVRTEAFATEAHRSSLAVALSRYEEDDQAFIGSVSALAHE